MASQCTVLTLSNKWVSRAFSIALLFLSFFVPSSNTSQKKPQSPQIDTIEVITVYPHDTQAFTEGLLYGGNNTLYESTGLFGKSTVRRVTLQTGKAVSIDLGASNWFHIRPEQFKQIISVNIYDGVGKLQGHEFIIFHTLQFFQGIFNHQMADGWGLATDGKILFGSDGSSTLYQIDLKTMKEIQRQTIRYMDLEVPYLNELEYVNGEVWANVGETDCIVRISPLDGTVLGWILLQSLRERLMASGEIGVQDILNGIAWDSDEKRIFVTGKCWPKLFEIKVCQSTDHSNVDIQRLCIPVPASLEAMK